MANESRTPDPAKQVPEETCPLANCQSLGDLRAPDSPTVV
jgi:hypothetical protein